MARLSQFLTDDGMVDTGQDTYFDMPGRPGQASPLLQLDQPQAPDPTGGQGYFNQPAAPIPGVYAQPTSPTAGSTTAPDAYDWSQWGDATDTAFTPAAQVGGQAGSQGWQGGTFEMPTVADFEANSTGRQYRLDQARQGVEASAFARGTGLTGGTATAIGQRVGDQASAEYEKFFNQRLAAFTENANVGLANAGLANDSARIANQSGQFNASLSEQHDQNQFGNVFNLAQLGLSAAGQANSAAGAYGSNTGNLATGYGQSVGNILTGQGNIRAEGSIGQGNIWSGLPGNLAGVANTYLAGRGNIRQPNAPS